METAYTFDDVLLCPKYSDIESRSQVDVSVKLSKGIELKCPIIPANMATITGLDMCRTMFQVGAMSIVHRFMPIQEQIDVPIKLAKECGDSVWNFVGLSVGVKKEDRETVDRMVKAGCRILTIDVAHGHSKMCIDMCKYISDKYPKVFLIAGNVATGEGAAALWRAGADTVKCGVGPGSLCSTRIETGNGFPQLSALEHVYNTSANITASGVEPRAYDDRFIIGDGGLKNAGDCVKALCYSHLVMAGNLFSGCDETPSSVIEENGVRYKEYAGSSTHKASRVEGVVARVPTKGKASDVLRRLIDGIQSGCSYQGAHNLKELKKNPKFVKISNASLVESHPHDVKVIR